jgi:hypothetical protein
MKENIHLQIKENTFGVYSNECVKILITMENYEKGKYPDM